MIKKLATIGVATAIFAASALPVFAVPPESPDPGCPSAFTGVQVVPSDSGVTPPPNKPNAPSAAFAPKPVDPAPDVDFMLGGGCTPPGA